MLAARARIFISLLALILPFLADLRINQGLLYHLYNQ